MPSTHEPSHGGSAPPEPPLSEILDAVRPHVERIEEGFKAIRITLDSLAAYLAGAPAAASPPAAVPVASAVTMPPPAVAAPAPVAAPILPPTAAPRPAPAPGLPPSVPAMTAAAAPAPAPAVPRVEPAARPESRPGSIPVTSGSAGNWSRIIFGDQPAAHPAIGAVSGSLLADVYAGDVDAISLAGQLMTFRAVTGERKPRLLKDLGEAFYAWKPRGGDAILQALIAWVHADLDSAAIPNRIDIVQVGDRYDMQRHNAKQPGVEVTEVAGWVVLRDNGKVFSKANVSVR
jgi:hypothetical protein